MGLFKHEARQFKFDVLRETAIHAFDDTITENFEVELSRKLIPGNTANFRCCVYKEREIIRQRTRLALGKMAAEVPYNPRQVVQVIDAACDGCSIKKIRITDNCRKCMAKNCMAACRFGAISMGADRAVIDYNKCKECGSCVRSCSYNAIVETNRPCRQACPVDAIQIGDNNIAYIMEDRCINCGSCQTVCPFGAIEDISWIVPVTKLLKEKAKVMAIVAPSIQGQFESATLPQIFQTIKNLGFDNVYEAALGADAVAMGEHRELEEKRAANTAMTTSCCPGFVNMIRLHFPEIYEKNMSSMVSPMVLTARWIKRQYPDYKIVFIGPCVAKKQEAMEDVAKSDVDYVLTFEELAAMMVARHMYPEEAVPADFAMPSVYGRNFAQGGGVSKAVLQASVEDGHGTDFTAKYADGGKECKQCLTMMKFGKFDSDILEGMACKGGCIGGPAMIEDILVTKGRMIKENMENKKNISEVLQEYDFEGLDLHRYED